MAARRALALLALLAGSPVLAGGPTPEASLESGAPPAARYPLTDTLSYGARLEAEYVAERNYDLAEARPDELALVQPALSVALSWRPAAALSAYGNVKLRRAVAIESEGRDEAHDTELLLDKLYVDLAPAGDWSLRLGRQRFKDHREWLLDDTLDGARLRWRRGDLTLLAAAMRERAFSEDLLDEAERNKSVDHVYLQAEWRRADRRLAVWLFRQRDPDRDETSRWLGLSGERRWGKTLKLWLDVARVDGERRGRDISGHGVDLGGLYRFSRRPRLYLVLAWAFGSGDEDDPDLGFRQTDLQDNAAKLGGVTRIVYYGEVFDPELSNLSIATAGLGWRPTRNSSVHLLWHRYRQDVALAALRESDLDAQPNGHDKDLGNEVDLVLAYRLRGRFKLEATAGRFLPGTAFGDGADDARLLHLEARYNF